MKRLILTTLLLTLIIPLVAQAQTQAQTYRWGLPQMIQTPVVQAAPFPAIPQRPMIRPRLSPHPASLPMPQVRKVRWEPSFPIATPLPLMPLTVSQGLPIYATAEARVRLQKIGLNFHADGLTLQTSNPVGEFGISIIDPKRLKVRYLFEMQQSASDRPIPSGALTIGNAALVTATAASPGTVPAASAATTPVKIDWQVGPSHRIDAICLRLAGQNNFWLSPAFVANWINLQVTGSTTTGTITTGTETVNGFYWGGGAEMVYQYPQSRLSALVVGGEKYLLADASLQWSLGNNLDLTAGYSWKQLKLEKETTARMMGPSLGVLVRF